MTWEKRAPGGIKLFDSITALLERQGLQTVPNYNRSDWLGLGGSTRRNIVRIDPGKQEFCRLSFPNLRRVSESENSLAREAWKGQGADLTEKANGRFSIGLSSSFVNQHEKFIADQVRRVFELCDRE
jgi:hypothetical protein